MPTACFQSTRSARSATDISKYFYSIQHFSIHALREERDDAQLLCAGRHSISIHALREERDSSMSRRTSVCTDFNPRAPRGARRGFSQKLRRVYEDFNPRAPRGARLCPSGRRSPARNFNPRAPRGARLHQREVWSRFNDISIHALREERDGMPSFYVQVGTQFQSTRSARSATRGCFRQCRGHQDFNPRAPRGARLPVIQVQLHIFSISIHALREERDCLFHWRQKLTPNFNPRAPRGARPAALSVGADSDNFNPRAPRGARLQAWQGRPC